MPPNSNDIVRSPDIIRTIGGDYYLQFLHKANGDNEKLALLNRDLENMRNFQPDCAGKEVAEVYKAYDGREALQVFAREKIDLAILDIMMPGIDGIHVCEKIREVSTDALEIRHAQQQWQPTLESWRIRYEPSDWQPKKQKVPVRRI